MKKPNETGSKSIIYNLLPQKWTPKLFMCLIVFFDFYFNFLFFLHEKKYFPNQWQILF